MLFFYLECLTLIIIFWVDNQYSLKLFKKIIIIVEERAIYKYLTKLYIISYIYY